MEKYAIIPKEKIDRIEIYINTEEKALAQIVQEKACDYAINGGLFDLGLFIPYCHLKANGIRYTSDQYTYWGYRWNNNTLPQLTYGNYTGYDNFICCVCMVRAGKKETMFYNEDVGRAAQRTAIGLFPDGRLWLYVTDKKLTPPELQNIALNEGLDSAIMLDGGGSTQGYFNGELIPAERKVHNLLLVYLKKEQPITAQQVIDCALAEVGTKETGINRIKYNTEYYGHEVEGPAYAWCAVFVWWVFHNLDADSLYYGGRKTASCTTLYNWAKAQGLAISGGYQPGDVVFFDWDGSGDCDHVGILVRVNSDGTITTIEGNQGDMVSYVTRSASAIAKAYRPRYKSEFDDEYAKACELLGTKEAWREIVISLARLLNG